MNKTVNKAIMIFCVALPAVARAGDSPSTLPPVVPPQIILAPTEVRSDPTLAKGCWVRLFPERNYKGQDHIMIAGPVEIPALRKPSGEVYWKHKAESLIAGPRASITVYENQSFRGPSADIKGGTNEANLRSGLGLMQSIDSLKIRCGQ